MIDLKSDLIIRTIYKILNGLDRKKKKSKKVNLNLLFYTHLLVMSFVVKQKL